MGESLMERHRVEDEGLRVVNSFSMGRSSASHQGEMLKYEFLILNFDSILKFRN